MTETDISDEQATEMLRQMADGKQNMHSFLGKVIKSDSTTRLGNLTDEELGMPKLPQRTNLELSLFCSDVVGDDTFADYFKKMAEIQTASSLSKNGFLMNLANTLKKELADVSPKPASSNKGWFRRKEGGVPAQ